MSKYKLYLDDGDRAITRSTARRYGLHRDFELQTDEVDPVPDPTEMCVEEEEELSSYEPTLEPRALAEDEDNIVFDEGWADDYMDLFDDPERYKNRSKRKYPETLIDFMKSDDFLQEIIARVDKSKGEIFWMILKFSILNNLSMVATTNLFKLINTMFEAPILPDSRYIVDKLLNPKTDVQFHAVCHNCSHYFGKFDEIDTSIKTCINCQVDIDLHSPSNTSYFVLIDPTTQISDLIHRHEEHYKYVVESRTHEKGMLKDVYDGKGYRKFVKSLPDHEKHTYVTGVMNTDGAAKFKCSQYSIWPIFIKINELPKQDRMNNLVTCGLFFHRKKPDMRVFIDKFVDLINKVTENGIPTEIFGEVRLLRFYILSCCVDSVARAPIQGIKQFNGTCGCSWCLHCGKYAAGSVRYYYSENVEDRDTQDTINTMLQVAENDRVICGIKYPSPLINFQHFDIVWGFTPDHLHWALEGVGGQFVNYYLEPLKDHEIGRLDELMNKFTVPQQIARLCRPLSTRNDWKAREFENFILYYSVPILSLILPKEKLDHWILFVQSIYIILKDEINILELNEANEMLRKFVEKSEKLYGIKSMTYNVHQMLHVCTSISYWGPAWTNSTFCFESGNFYLLKAINCARGVTQQVIRFVNMNRSLLLIEQCLRPRASHSILTFCDDILPVKTRNINRTSDITYFGRSDDDAYDMEALQLSTNASFYYKMVKSKCLYESRLIQKKRSNNSFAKLKNGSYVRIEGFIVDAGTNFEKTVCNVVHTKIFNKLYINMIAVDKIDDFSTIVPTEDIERVCVFINIYNNNFLCPVPNLLHY